MQYDFNHDPFQKADRISIIDRFLAATIGRIIPLAVTPNHITLVRIIFTPFVIAVLALGYYKIGLCFFLAVAFTDAIDGAMARTRNQITNWGKLFDPLADKLLIGSIVFVVVIKELNVWLGITILMIELSTILLAAWKRHEGVVLQANIWGKIKMNLEVLGVAILILGLFTGWPPFFPFSQTVFSLAIIFALISIGSRGI